MPHIAADPPPELIDAIAAISERGVPADTALLTEALQARFGDALLAVVLYGSCLRMQQFDEGVIDLYVIVNRYDAAWPDLLSRQLNAWLPPNVYYLETAAAAGILRAKYAVLSLEDLQRGCTRWFHSYLWSRFAQPSRLILTRDTGVRSGIYKLFAQALLKFLRSTLPAIEQTVCDTAAIWENGLGLTYAAELRPERGTRARDITQQNIADFRQLTRLAAPALTTYVSTEAADRYRIHTTKVLRRRTRRLWRLRRWQGMLLSILRFCKAAYTFSGGVDYAAWKIERHTGMHIEITPGLRRHPVLFGFRVLWRLVRRGVMH